jgi:hypothetical protein
MLRKRGPKVDPLAEENAALRQRIDRLEADLKCAETVIEVQKVSALLELSDPSNRKSDGIK